MEIEEVFKNFLVLEVPFLIEPVSLKQEPREDHHQKHDVKQVSCGSDADVGNLFFEQEFVPVKPDENACKKPIDQTEVTHLVPRDFPTIR